MRAYERDEVKIKIQIGATEEQHQATIHGLKWLSNGSGFGQSPNSGWRNFQSHGISEQFSLQVPVNPDPDQAGNRRGLPVRDRRHPRRHLARCLGHAACATANNRGDLFRLPGNTNPQAARINNADDFAGVCPAVTTTTGQGNNQVTTTEILNLVEYDVTAVLANDVLPNNLGVTIPQLGDVDPQFPTTTFGQQTVGGLLDPNGGTLVYNRRGTTVPTVNVNDAGVITTFRGGDGPLNDPTAMMYVLTENLVDPDDPKSGLKPGTPVEPLVLRANAGDCIEVTLRNALPAVAPDLAGWQDMMWVVNRDLFNPIRPPEMHFFNNNLIRPSSHVGLHAAARGV